ncbi:MAG TPA: lysophospholipid acyltransferase family protein [Casimicrobiaceae bacterium]|nr:lysophospholipid acyltransferase family protein [Casimicrobiaceae bacterium]
MRLSVHLLQGVATTALVFPLVGTRRRQALIRRWSAALLAILCAELRINGWPAGGLPGNVLIVANHISWLDIFVINAAQPARFVAKADLAQWPLVGRLIAGVGTLFIERGRGRDAHRINHRACAVLASGDVIAIFPEGMTSDGSELLPFHGSLLQPVIDARGHVQPMAIRYRGSNDEYNDSAAYVGDMKFLTSLWRVLGERRMIVLLDLVPPIPANGRHRRHLARDAEEAIRQVLASSASGPAPGTAFGRSA